MPQFAAIPTKHQTMLLPSWIWRRAAILSVAVVCFLIPFKQSNAQGLGCGGRLVDFGESRASLVLKCGQPLTMEIVCIRVPRAVWTLPMHPHEAPRQYISEQCEYLDEWTFYRGPGNFMSVIRLKNGRVVQIRDGARAP